jgi:mono/diheme cytochrome c family protein
VKEIDMKYKTILILPIAAVALTLAACGADSKEHKAQASASRDVHAIEMPKYQANLPAGPGQEAFATACLSCHTARYIAMQPPLTAVKWEESVRKMMKTYAAPIAEEQVPQIVQYLMTTKESGQGGSWIALAANTNQKPAPAIAIDSADLARGSAVYAKNCASCHGEKGAGDGLSAKTLLPHPTDLTSAVYSVQAMTSAVYNGVAATAMPAFPMLPKEDLAAVVAYSISLSKSKADVKKPADAANAQALFVQSCAKCHGTDGSGNGLAAPTSPRPPANFRATQPSADSAFKIITDGIPGSTMPAWKAKLSDDQRKSLAQYVRTFYQDATPASRTPH